MKRGADSKTGTLSILPRNWMLAVLPNFGEGRERSVALRDVAGLDSRSYAISFCGTFPRSVMDHSQQFLKLVKEAKSHVKETTVAEVKRRQAAGEKMELVDVREESEFAAGHAKGARHLSKGVIERDIAQAIPD